MKRADKKEKLQEVISKKEALLKSYSDWLRMRNYSVQTYKSYMGTIRNFWKFCTLRKGDASFKKSRCCTNIFVLSLA